MRSDVIQVAFLAFILWLVFGYSAAYDEWNKTTNYGKSKPKRWDKLKAYVRGYVYTALAMATIIGLYAGCCYLVNR